MGIYRFILAIAVALSHIGCTWNGYNQGVVAVISFLLISGYTMTLLMEKYYIDTTYSKYFYLDRFLRLWPQIALYIGLTLLLIFVMPLNEELKAMYLSDVTVGGVGLQLLLLPLGYYMFLLFDDGFILPQSWTIGLEVTFYLIFPFIYHKNLRKPAVIVSIIVFFCLHIVE